MVSESQRRFSLDKVEVSPEILNRINSANGDEMLGQWDGECIDDLVAELNRIEEFADPAYSSLPHSRNIPEDLKNQVEKDYPIWACDKSGRCLVGRQADKVRHIDKIRKHYEKKYGGIEQFKEKIRKEIEERDANLWQK